MVSVAAVLCINIYCVSADIPVQVRFDPYKRIAEGLNSENFYVSVASQRATQWRSQWLM